MNLFEKLDKIMEGGLQRLVQSSLGPGTCADFLESYARALEDIQARIQSVRGRKIFPYKRIALKFVLADPGQVPLLAPILGQKRQLSSEVRRRLEEAGCEPSGTLRVDATAIVSSDPNLAGQPYEISYDSELPPQSPLSVQVLRGEAERPTYRFAERTVNILSLIHISWGVVCPGTVRRGRAANGAPGRHVVDQRFKPGANVGRMASPSVARQFKPWDI